MEYTIVFTLIALALLYSKLQNKFYLFMVIAMPLQYFNLETAYLLHSRPRILDLMVGGLREAIDKIPAGPAKIFNCHWNAGPVLFYMRPDLLFVDVAGPFYLMSARPDLSNSRDILISGQSLNPYAEIKNYFKADYVLCNDLPLVQQLQSNLDFEQLTPIGARYHLFRLKSQPSNELPSR
jgi:hypothetical protein